MDTWLYDLDPLEALSYEKSLDVLRKGIDNGYFEDLIRRYILDNATTLWYRWYRNRALRKNTTRP